MRTPRRLAAVLAVLGVALTACSSAAGNQAASQSAAQSSAVATNVDFPAGTTMARLHDANAIKIGTKFDQPGFGLRNPQGVPEGFDVEVAKIVAGKLGIAPDKIQWVETVSANREPFIQNGQVQAVTTDNVILTGLVAGAPDAFELVGKPFTQEPYGIGLKKGDDAFRSFVNDTLEASFKDGSWAAAWDRTAGAISKQPAPQPPAVDRY